MSKINTHVTATDRTLKHMSIDRDSELQKVLKLQRDLGIRIRNEARQNIMTSKINFEFLRRDADAPRAVRDLRDPEGRQEVKRDWLLDVRTGDREPILDLIDEVRRLASKPEYKGLLTDHPVEISRPVTEYVNGQLEAVGPMSNYATMVPEEEMLLPAEMGVEDGVKVLSQELELVRTKIRMALVEQNEIVETMRQETIQVPRISFAWNQQFKGIHTTRYLYAMQKRYQEKDLHGLYDESVDEETRRKEVMRLRQTTTAQEEHQFVQWKAKTVAQTSSLKRTLSTLGEHLSRRLSYQRKGDIALPNHTPAAGY